MHTCTRAYILTYIQTYNVYTHTEVRKKNASRQEAKEEISKLVGRLQGLKRKLEGVYIYVYTYIRMCVCVCCETEARGHPFSKSASSSFA